MREAIGRGPRPFNSLTIQETEQEFALRAMRRADAEVARSGRTFDGDCEGP